MAKSKLTPLISYPPLRELANPGPAEDCVWGAASYNHGYG